MLSLLLINPIWPSAIWKENRCELQRYHHPISCPKKGKFDRRTFRSQVITIGNSRTYLLGASRRDLGLMRFKITPGCRVFDSGVVYYVPEMWYYVPRTFFFVSELLSFLRLLIEGVSFLPADSSETLGIWTLSVVPCSMNKVHSVNYDRFSTMSSNSALCESWSWSVWKRDLTDPTSGFFLKDRRTENNLSEITFGEKKSVQAFRLYIIRLLFQPYIANIGVWTVSFLLCIMKANSVLCSYEIACPIVYTQ